MSGSPTTQLYEGSCQCSKPLAARDHLVCQTCWNSLPSLLQAEWIYYQSNPISDADLKQIEHNITQYLTAEPHQRENRWSLEAVVEDLARVDMSLKLSFEDSLDYRYHATVTEETDDSRILHQYSGCGNTVALAIVDVLTIVPGI